MDAIQDSTYIFLNSRDIFKDSPVSDAKVPGTQTIAFV